ncbi:MAG: MFS transporter [Methanobacteriaceae archaeon]|nr:MFS transporter [Methanobacteriaceae archaeon]
MVNVNKKWAALIAVALSTFLISLDSTFMNVAINSLVIDLNTTVSTVQLIITFYTFITASLMLVTSKLMDIIGKKRVFVLGAISFAVGTLIASLSTNPIILFMGWSFFEGIGAALMLPATITIVTGTYKDKDLTMALAIMSALGGIAAAIGPLFGGFVTTFLSWRYGFAIELLVVIFILIFTKNIKKFETTLHKSDFDIIGAILSITSLVILITGVLNLSDFSKLTETITLLILGAIFITIFYYYEKYRIKSNLNPLLDLRMFKTAPNLKLGTLLRLISMIGVAGSIFSISLYLQSIAKVDAFTNGLVLMPLTLGLLIFSLFSTKLTKYLSHKRIITIGFILSIIGLLFLRTRFGLNLNLYTLIPGMFIFGSGMGLIISLSLDSSLLGVKDENHTGASGFLTTGANLGSSVGTALIGTILILGSVSGLHSAINTYYPNQITNQQFKSNLALYFQKMGNVNITTLKGKETIGAQIINTVIHQAMFTALDAMIVIMIIGLILSLFLKEKTDLKKN